MKRQKQKREKAFGIKEFMLAPSRLIVFTVICPPHPMCRGSIKPANKVTKEAAQPLRCSVGDIRRRDMLWRPLHVWSTVVPLTPPTPLRRRRSRSAPSVLPPVCRPFVSSLRSLCHCTNLHIKPVLFLISSSFLSVALWSCVVSMLPAPPPCQTHSVFCVVPKALRLRRR